MPRPTNNSKVVFFHKKYAEWCKRHKQTPDSRMRACDGKEVIDGIVRPNTGAPMLVIAPWCRRVPLTKQPANQARGAGLKVPIQTPLVFDAEQYRTWCEDNAINHHGQRWSDQCDGQPTDGFTVVGRDGEIREVNPAWCRISDQF